MSYTVIDLIEKLAELERNAANMYNSLAKSEGTATNPFKTVAKVLALEEERHIEYYKKLIKEAAAFSDIDIDVDLYDRASKLINEFGRRITAPKENDPKKLLYFALEFEKQNAALLIDIRGRLFKNAEDSESTIYMAITDMILQEEKHIRNIEPYI